MQLPTIKKYDIDYEFLIKNYLDPSLWEKNWTLLEYKTFVISLSLESINCQENSIMFKVGYDDNEYEYRNSTYFKYNIKNSTIRFLKKSIKGKILEVIINMECNRLRHSTGYDDINQKYSDEQELLTQIASNFLDDEGVTNEDIRDCYIDDYVYKNKQLDLKLNIYISKHKYLILSDFYLLIAKIYNDIDLENTVCIHLADKDKISSLMSEIQELYEYMQTEEYEKEMKAELDDI